MLSVLHRHRLKTAAFLIGVLLMMLGCGFDAVLKSPGPAAVSFVFSDTVLTRNTIVPLVVTVIADGVPQTHPYVIAFTYDPRVVSVTPDDSLVATGAGVDSINIRFKSTLRASVADTIIPIRVHP
jgi:hypothetical protein